MSSTEWKHVENPTWPCHKCRQAGQIEYSVWTSYDEAHEDMHYRCKACGYDWWVEGPDY